MDPAARDAFPKNALSLDDAPGSLNQPFAGNKYAATG